MEDYNISFMKSANRYIGFEGKRILEIGCGDGTLTEQIARDYRPEKIIGIDPMLEIWWGKRPEANENWELKKGDVTALEFPDNYFDAVITVATFEHIIDMKKALSEIKRVLKPLGKLYSIFAPIWTSVIGHHHCFWIDEEHVKMIPPWGHLWMTEEQMYEHISINYSEENAKNACYQIYHSDEINRFARKDFYKFFIENGSFNYFFFL